MMNYTFNTEYAAIAAKFPATNLTPKSGFPVLVIPNALTKRTTRETYFKVRKSVFTGGTPTRATVYTPDGAGSTVAENYRKADIFTLDLMHSPTLTCQQLNEAIKDAVAQTWGLAVVPVAPWWLAGYGVGDKFEPHCDGTIQLPDNSHKSIEDRVISAILYVNPKDDNTTGWGYTGGSLVFPGILDEAGQPLTISPREGDLVIFPSSWVYTHGVKEVTSGYRLAMTNFFRAGG